MNPTSLSLLDRLRHQPTPNDWQRLHDLYLPLIRRWLGRVPGLHDEADDLAQEVLVTVFRELAGFERQRTGSFRAWLRAIAVNRVRSHWRSPQRRPVIVLLGRRDETEDYLNQLEDPHSDLSRQWDLDHDRHAFDRLLGLVRPDFTEQTWEAFHRFAIEGRLARDVAAELTMSVSAVFLAKSRILKRLRDEAGGILD